MDGKLSFLNKRMDSLYEEIKHTKLKSDSQHSKKSDHGMSTSYESFPGPVSDGEGSDTDTSDTGLEELRTSLEPETITSAVRSLPGNQQLSLSHSFIPTKAKEVLDMEFFSPVMQESFTHCLGRKQDVYKLINMYFEKLNILRHPMPEDIMAQALDGVYEHNGQITETNLSKFCLVVAVVGITVLFLNVSYPELISKLELDTSQLDCDAPRRLTNVAKIACGATQNLNREDHYVILAYGILSRYYFVTGNQGRSWAAVVEMVRLAHSLGLHRDGTVFDLDPETCEQRRMIWALVYPPAQNHSLGYGRPPLIVNIMTDTRPPHPVTPIEQVPESIRHLFKKVDPPNLLTINMIRVQFAKFLSVLCLELHSVVKTFTYSKVLKLHMEFKAFVSNLPFYFQVNPMHGSLSLSPECDEHFPFLKLQRCYLWFDIAFFYLSLHCPYLLRMLGRNNPKQRYMLSYDSCMDAVKLSLAMRHNLLKDMPDNNRTTLLAFRWFNTTVVAGILLLLTPPGKNADTLRGFMEEFIAWRQKQQYLGREVESQKDIATIRAFLHEDTRRSQGDSTWNEPDAQPNESVDTKRRRTHYDNGTSNDEKNKSSDTSASPANDQNPKLQGFPAGPWPSGDLPLDMSVHTPGMFMWPDSQSMDQGSNVLHEALTGLPSELPTIPMFTDPSAPSSAGVGMPVPTLNLGGMFRLPSILPQDGMSPRTMMPIWPMNAGSMPNASQALKVDVTHQDQDTHELLNLW